MKTYNTINELANKLFADGAKTIIAIDTEIGVMVAFDHDNFATRIFRNAGKPTAEDTLKGILYGNHFGQPGTVDLVDKGALSNNFITFNGDDYAGSITLHEISYISVRDNFVLGGAKPTLYKVTTTDDGMSLEEVDGNIVDIFFENAA